MDILPEADQSLGEKNQIVKFVPLFAQFSIELCFALCLANAIDLR